MFRVFRVDKASASDLQKPLNPGLDDLRSEELNEALPLSSGPLGPSRTTSVNPLHWDDVHTSEESSVRRPFSTRPPVWQLEEDPDGSLLFHDEESIADLAHTDNWFPVPSGPEAELGALRAKDLVFNYLASCALVALVWATCLSGWYYSTLELGELGTAVNLTMFGMMPLSALFVAPLLIARIGSQKALAAGCLLCSFSVWPFIYGAECGNDGLRRCSFALFRDYPFDGEASSIEDFRDAVAWTLGVPGAVAGGLGQGIFWVAQGSFMLQSACGYAINADADQSTATAKFNAIFIVTVAACTSCAFVIFGTSIQVFGRAPLEVILFGSAVIAAGASVVLVALSNVAESKFDLAKPKALAWDRSVSYGTLAPSRPMTPHGPPSTTLTDSDLQLQPEEEASAQKERVRHIQFAGALQSHPLFLKMLPVNATSGLCLALLITLLRHRLINHYLGEKAYPFILAVYFAAVCAAPPTAVALMRHFKNGRLTCLFQGQACFVGAAMLVVMAHHFTTEQGDVATWLNCSAIALAMGFGQGMWEFTSRLTVADYFGQSSYAFGTMWFHQGIFLLIGAILSNVITVMEIACVVATVGFMSVVLLLSTFSEKMETDIKRKTHLVLDPVKDVDPLLSGNLFLAEHSKDDAFPTF
ncbi:hypothetical protein CYMTET_42477 [Cymbomonas tetramitiformis]|uniref:Uncharacterized protein n=1 Tax=Cymbomonas tetramitiformis TaxID=36881 RepID=A0AAE0C3Z4_9CHLO|nr:hypothetical protein CYMTET_42477 [Cymbomonas tetramitiformis]